MKRSALTHRHHGRHHRWNILLYLNQLQGHLYAETLHTTEDLQTILTQLDVSSRTSLFLWGTNVDCIPALTHINFIYTVWREIFAGQNFRGFRGFTSDRKNFNHKILPTTQATPFSCNMCGFAIVEPRKFLREIFASGQSAKILSRENFAPYGIYILALGGHSSDCTTRDCRVVEFHDIA